MSLGGTMVFSGPTDIIGDVDNQLGALIVSAGGGPLTFFDDVVNNGEIRTSEGSFTTFFGSTTGSGTYPGTGTVIMEADFTPGSSPGINNFGGNLVLGPAATLELEAQATITPPVAGTDHDQINITANVTLNGTLNVIPLTTAGPIQDTPLGTEFDAITYTTRTAASMFHTITGTLINTAFALAPILDDTTGTLILRATIPGDTNLDNMVSVADLSTFALNFGTTPGLYNETLMLNSWELGDFNTDGQITVADLSLLALNFGFDLDAATAATGLSLAAVASLAGIDLSAVPEPSSVSLLVIAMATCMDRRRACRPARRRR